MASERVDKNTLVGVPPMSLACYSDEHNPCRVAGCQCSCHPPIYTQAQLDAAIAKAVVVEAALTDLAREAAEMGCLRGRQIHCAERESNSADWCVPCKAKHVLPDPQSAAKEESK